MVGTYFVATTMFLSLEIRKMSTVRRFLNKRLFNSVFNNKKQWFGTLTSSELSDPNVIKSEGNDIQQPNSNISEFLYSAFEPYNKYYATECGITGKKYTYGQLRSKSIDFGKALRKKFALSKGDVVSIFMQNNPDFIISVFGILSAGLVVTTLNPMYTSDEVSKQLLDSGAKIVITQSDLYNTAQNGLKVAQNNLPIICVKQKQSDPLPAGAINFEELVNSKINDVPDIVSSNLNDLALLLYSSGTSGTPKGVEISHSNIIANVLQMSHPRFQIHSKPTGDDQNVSALVLPMYHVYGLVVNVFTGIYSSSKIVTLPRFTPDTFIDMLKKHKVTHLLAAPPLILFITTSADIKSEDLSGLRLVMSGAAPLKFTDEMRFIEKLNNETCSVRQGYGLTETSPVVSVTPRNSPRIETLGGSVGKLLPNTFVKIIDPNDPTGKALGPNVQGELLVKGLQVTRGYLNRPEATQNTFLDGWFKTGDMAVYNEDEYFFITDRIKELIKVKGFQVPPAELEGVIRTFPGVEEVGVVGIPHPTQGEVPRAYVVVNEGHAFKPEELNNYLGTKLAKYKQLVGGISVVDSIPKNPSGKILRRLLKEQFLKKGI